MSKRVKSATSEADPDRTRSGEGKGSGSAAVPPVRHSVTVSGSPREVFRLFTPVPGGEASEVELRLLAAGAGTRVELEHRDFERHGQGAEALRAGLDSPQGWPTILAELRRAASAATARVGEMRALGSSHTRPPASGVPRH